MSNNGLRVPLHHATPTQVYIRVTYHLIRLHHKHNEQLYGAFPAVGIGHLLDDLKPFRFGAIFAYTQAAQRHVLGGMSMREWRTLEPWNWRRSVFKQRWRR